MPDKYGQLLPGEEEQGIEEVDLYDYIVPIKGAVASAGTKSLGMISRLIKKGIAKKVANPENIKKQVEAVENYYRNEARKPTSTKTWATTGELPADWKTSLRTKSE
jgi:hypothetical protein